MNFKGHKISYTVTIILAIGALCAGIFVAQHAYTTKKIDVTRFHGTFLENPRAVNQFDLVGTDEKPFNNFSLKGQWTMVFFGFTQCGYMCPTTLTELGKMYKLLENKQMAHLPRVVMITLDPERDDLIKLGRYVTSFNPSFYGARGDKATLKALTREMGIAYAKVLQGSDSSNYDIQHSGAVMLFNPQGELNAFFTTPHKAELLAKDYELLVS